MYLHEIFDLTLTKGQGHTKHCPLHRVTYVQMYLQCLLQQMFKKMHLQENTVFYLWPWPQGLGGEGHMPCGPVPST